MIVNKTIYVYKGDHDIYSSAADFLKLIQDAIDKVPEEYKKEAKINITTHSCGCYNDYESCVEIYYSCPKTEEELAKEKRKDKYQEKARIFQLEKELAELKKRGEKK
jgi:aspartate/tyrosine/aromatic aminotransferase